MALTDEQISELKAQLRGQVQNMPEDKRSAALAQIESLSADALEAMLKEQQSKGPEKGVYRMIIDKDIKSVDIDENDWALAVLDIAPISKGHAIVIPKSPVTKVDEVPKQAAELASELAKRIQKKLEAKSVEIKSEFKFGEYIVNLIPIYDSPLTLQSPRKKASTEELEDLAPSLREIKKPKIEKIKIKKTIDPQNQNLKLPRRIP